MRSFVLGALLLRTLNAQVLVDPLISPDAVSVALAPLLTPGPDAPTEAQLSAAAAAAALAILISAASDSVLPIGTADVILSESSSYAIAPVPTGTETASALNALLISSTALSSSDTASASDSVVSSSASITETLVIPLGPGVLAASTPVSSTISPSNAASGSNVGAQAVAVGARPNANFAGSARPGGGWSGGDDDSSYDGQDYGDDLDDGQTQDAPDGSEYHGSGDDIQCPADCTCEVETPEHDSHEGYPPPPGYSPTPNYPGDDGGDGDEGDDVRRTLRARQAASGGFAAFNWPGASDDSGDSASDDVPDWLYDSAGVARPKPYCPKACCNKPSGGYPSQPTAKYPIDPAPNYTRRPMRPSGYMPAPTGYVDPYSPASTDEPWYNSNSNNTAYASGSTTDEPAAPTWTTLASPAVSDVHMPAVSDVHEPAVPDVHEPAVPDVHEPAVPDVHEPAVPDVHEPDVHAPAPSAESTPAVLDNNAPAPSADYTGDTLAGICPKTCNPDADKNFCDMTTSCTTTGGSKNYCACRAGYMASAWNAKDFSKQFHVNGQPFVYVAPGVVCDKVCDDQTCTAVLTRPACA